MIYPTQRLHLVHVGTVGTQAIPGPKSSPPLCVLPLLPFAWPQRGGSGPGSHARTDWNSWKIVGKYGGDDHPSRYEGNPVIKK